jgi:hypothetical protein
MSRKKTIQNTIKWLDPVLQALSFWIGYKKELYRHHLLSEGAIVAELAFLINSKLKKNEIVKCEEHYKKIVKQINNQSRADILIEKENQPFIVIEVKRNNSSKKLIDFDLKKLANLKKIKPELRVFLILISQRRKPSQYVTHNGESDKIYYQIKNTEFSAYAKRVCKSSSSFRSNSRVNSNYAILIEVLKREK